MVGLGPSETFQKSFWRKVPESLKTSRGFNVVISRQYLGLETNKQTKKISWGNITSNAKILTPYNNSKNNKLSISAIKLQSAIVISFK